MPKFIFRCEHGGLYSNEPVSTNTTEFKAESLSEVLENFEMFLRGSGYVFQGQLDFIEEDSFELREDYSEEFNNPISAVWPFPQNKASVPNPIDPINFEGPIENWDNGVIWNSNTEQKEGDNEDIIHFRV